MNLFDAVKRQIQGFDPMIYIDKVSNFYVFLYLLLLQCVCLFKTLHTWQCLPCFLFVCLFFLIILE